jgi:hypothetical protein
MDRQNDAAPESLIRRVQRAALPFWIGLAICVLALLLPGWVMGTQADMRAAQSWPVVDGAITRSEVARKPGANDRAPTFGFTVAYTFNFKGETHEGARLDAVTITSGTQSAMNALAARYPVGAPVKVHVNPLAPKEAMLNITPPQPVPRGVTVFLLMFGGLFVWLGLRGRRG